MSKVSISEYLQLQGKTLKERHKSLNSLVSNAPDHLLDADKLINLHSKTQVELVFIAKVADNKKNGRVICELLKSEYTIVVHTALCAKWLFRGMSHYDYCNANYFVTKIFPFASYHSTCRIIANFGAYLKNEEIADEFFKVVRDLYGWKLASKILPSCSYDCIKAQLNLRPITVPCAILYKIYLKQNTMATDYLEDYVAMYFESKAKKLFHFPFVNYDKVLRKIALDNPKRFIDIVNKYPDTCKEKEIAGKRTTKKLLKKFPNEVVRYSKNIHYSINNKVVVNTLKGVTLEQYLINSLPDYYDHFPFALSLSRLREKQRIVLAYKLHPLKYNGESLLNRENYLTCPQMKYVPVKDRIAWAQNKTNGLNVKMQKPYYKYLPPLTAVPLLCQDVHTAEKTFDTFKEMADCFVINDNEKGLIKTISQVTDIVRQNESTAEYCLAFLYHIKHSYNIYKVSVELWTAITRLIEKLSQSGNITSTQRLFLMSYICDQLRFQVHHDLKFDHILNNVFVSYKSEFWHLYILDLAMSISIPEHRIKFIRKFVENLRAFMGGVNMSKYEVWKNIMFIIKLYSEAKKQVGVSFTEWEWILTSIHINIHHWTCNQNKDLMIEINKDSKGRKLFYKEIFMYSLDTPILLWLLENDVDFVVTNIPIFCSYFTNDLIPLHSKERKKYHFKHDSAVFIRCFMRLWDHFELPSEPFPHISTLKSFSKRLYIINKVSVYFFDTLKNTMVLFLSEKIRIHFKDLSKQQASQIILMCLLLPAAEGKAYLEANTPKLGGLSKNLGFYKTLTIALQYVMPPISYGLLMKFFDHGCLAFVQTSGFSIVSKKSLKDTRIFVQDLMKELVTIKKMGVHLSFMVCPRKELLVWYTEIWNQNMNNQIKAVVFKKVFKLMLEEDKEQTCLEIWKVLKQFFGGMSEGDCKFLKYIGHSDRVALRPVIYTEYCDVTMKLFKSLKLPVLKIKPYKKMFMESICKNPNALEESFFEYHTLEIWKHIEALDTDNVYEILPLVIAYLTRHRDDLTHKNCLMRICNSFTNCGYRMQRSSMDKFCLYEEYLKDFIVGLCRASMKVTDELSLLNVTSCESLIMEKIQSTNIMFKSYVKVFIHLTSFFISECITDGVSFNDFFKLYSNTNKINKSIGESYWKLLCKLGNLENFAMYCKALKEWITYLCEGQTKYVYFQVSMGILNGFFNELIKIKNFQMLKLLLPEYYCRGSQFSSVYRHISSVLRTNFNSFQFIP